MRDGRNYKWESHNGPHYDVVESGLGDVLHISTSIPTSMCIRFESKMTWFEALHISRQLLGEFNIGIEQQSNNDFDILYILCDSWFSIGYHTSEASPRRIIDMEALVALCFNKINGVKNELKLVPRINFKIFSKFVNIFDFSFSHQYLWYWKYMSMIELSR